MKRSVSMAVVLVALASGVAGSYAETGPPAPAAPTEVRIDNFSFGPAELTVQVGTTVRWTNRDDIPHTVVSTDKVFKSKVLDTDETFSFTFNELLPDSICSTMGTARSGSLRTSPRRASSFKSSSETASGDTA